MGALIALFKRDIALASSQGGMATALGFILCVIVLVPLSLGPDQALLSRLAPGVMWMALLLSVLLTADRIFQQDLEDGTLDVMTMTDLPFALVTLTKSFTHWLSVSLPLALVAPALSLLLSVDAKLIPPLWLGMIPGSLALSLLASIGGALSAGLKRGSLLISLLVFPLYVPVLIFGISVSAGDTPQTSHIALLLLLALTLVALIISPLASAAALKAYLR